MALTPGLTVGLRQTGAMSADGCRKETSMTSVVSHDLTVDQERSPSVKASQRAHALAESLEQGVHALVDFASDLTEAEWHSRVPHDGRTVGVIVHHVASVYPLEIQLAQTLAGGKPVEGVTMDNVHEMNAAHAKEHDMGKAIALHGVSKRVQAIDLVGHPRGRAQPAQAIGDLLLRRGIGAPCRRVAAPERLGGSLGGARIGLGRASERAREEAKRASKARALVGNL